MGINNLKNSNNDIWFLTYLIIKTRYMAGKGFIEEVKMLMEIDSVWKWNIWKSIHHTSNGIKLSIETLKKIIERVN